jgi:hypothetical protein
MGEQRGPVPRQAVPPSGEQGPYLTVAEAASFLRVDVADVLDGIREGALPTFGGLGGPLIDRVALFRKLDPLYEAPPKGSLQSRVDVAARVCEEIVGEGYVSAEWRAAASRLLGDLVSVAKRHGVSMSDFDRVTDLPQACLDALAPAYRPRRRPSLRRINGGYGGR